MFQKSILSSKINKGLKEQGLKARKIPRSEGHYFGECEFKSTYRYTTVGFDMKEFQFQGKYYTEIWSRGGTGYNGID